MIGISSCITLIVYAIQRAGTFIGFFGLENYDECDAYGGSLFFFLKEEECA